MLPWPLPACAEVDAFVEPWQLMMRCRDLYPWVSYSDLMTLGAASAVEFAGGPKVGAASCRGPYRYFDATCICAIQECIAKYSSHVLPLPFAKLSAYMRRLTRHPTDDAS